jgi:c-di-GMP-binding flagellar brake protein YcgR
VPFRCVAAVVRCQPAGEGGYDCGLSFIELSPTTQRRLVRVVLELQRVQLRNQGGEG